MNSYVDRITDSDGDTVEIGTYGDKVVIGFDADNGDGRHTGEVHLDAGLRDRFAKAYAQAERQAEAARDGN